jgi:hypothetical protein
MIVGREHQVHTDAAGMRRVGELAQEAGPRVACLGIKQARMAARRVAQVKAVHQQPERVEPA